MKTTTHQLALAYGHGRPAKHKPTHAGCNRHGINRKLRARQGKRRGRAKDGILHPLRNPDASCIRAASTKRMWLERQTMRVYCDGFALACSKRLEEPATRAILQGLPSIAQLAKDMREKRYGQNRKDWNVKNFHR